MDLNIGLRIRKRREELNLTQDELAKKLGYANRSSVNKVENSREISMKKISAYANALDTTVADLMGWEDKSNIIETAKTDIMLSNMEEKLKEYALKMAKLPKEKQDLVLKMIDELGK